MINDYRWKFRDGTRVFEANPEHTFANPGSYNVRLVVCDGGGLCDTTWIRINVTESFVNQPPQAIPQADVLDGIAPLVVQFTGSNSIDSTRCDNFLSLEIP